MIGVTLLVAAAALLAPAPPAGGRQFRCACAEPLCPDTPSRTCVTEYQCFTQYITDDFEPLAYGCLPGRTQLLCENWVHRVVNQSGRPSSPSVVCCDTDLCNRRPTPTPRPTVPPANSTEIPQDLLTHIIAGRGKTISTPHTFYNRMYPLDRPIVLSALFVGLFFLLAILTFGFYLLHKQSRAVKRMWKNRNESDLTLSLVDVVQSTC